MTNYLCKKGHFPGKDGANGGIPGAGIYEADQVITLMIIGDHWMNIITDVFQFKAPSYY